MNDREREAYLNRIGYEGELRTDKKCLEKIMDLHLCSIPFENLEVFDAGRIPSLRSEDIYEKIIVRKRGGYCFELNKLFYELLKALDFRVIPVAVRILWNREELPPVLHRATLVIFEEGSYYCDVGYGGPGPKKPVLMKEFLLCKISRCINYQKKSGEHLQTGRKCCADRGCSYNPEGRWIH